VKGKKRGPEKKLVVDVGNTETAGGVFRGGEIAHTWRVATHSSRTADEWALLFHALLDRVGLEGRSFAQIVIGSVVPGATGPLSRALQRLSPGAVRVIDGGDGVELPIHLDVEEPRTVGADRIVNTLAAKERFARDTIVVDLGTATTYDCITGEGVFVGGVIAPGLQAGVEWLGRSTAKLPAVVPVPPERVIGRRTEACMQSGVFYSAVDAIDGIVERIRDEWERPDALVVATGGLAEAVAGHTRTVDRVEPHLTLHGLALAGRLGAWR